MEYERNIKKGMENEVIPCCTFFEWLGPISVRVEEENLKKCAFTKNH